MKLFSCGDDGIFSNNKLCVLLLKDAHSYSIWGYDFLFNDVDTPKIGKERTRRSSPRHKKLFCLHCMVSYSNDHLHVCRGRCHRCLGTNNEHEMAAAHDDRELFYDNCGRYFLQESCFESHKALKLFGEYKSYCEFLCTLGNCDECRRAFNLSVKCRHFGKKRKCVGRNIYFSDVVIHNY